MVRLPTKNGFTAVLSTSKRGISLPAGRRDGSMVGPVGEDCNDNDDEDDDDDDEEEEEDDDDDSS